MKARNWTILVYPDSVKEDWQTTLREMGLICAISPLHDKDIKKDGETVKPHYHVIITFPDGSVTEKSVTEICESINAYPIPQVCRNVEKMHDYLWHGEYNDDEKSVIPKE